MFRKLKKKFAPPVVSYRLRSEPKTTGRRSHASQVTLLTACPTKGRSRFGHGTRANLFPVHSFHPSSSSSSSSHSHRPSSAPKTKPTTIHYRNGDCYTGTVLVSNPLIRHGQGSYTFASGDRYNGTYEMDNKQGYGTYYFRSGDMYEGQFHNNMKHGSGLYEWGSSGKTLRGEWRCDKFFSEEKSDEGLVGLNPRCGLGRQHGHGHGGEWLDSMGPIGAVCCAEFDFEDEGVRV